MQSFRKKIGSILTNGIEPISEGVSNYNNPKPDTESLAKDRLSICASCPMFKTEPIPFLRVKDERLPEASDMFCDDCGCTLPYKLRQSLSLCKKWEK
jgi:hypothetical protein